MFFKKKDQATIRVYYNDDFPKGWYWELRFSNYQFAAKNIYAYASKPGCLKALKNIRKRIKNAKIVIENRP